MSLLSRLLLFSCFLLASDAWSRPSDSPHPRLLFSRAQEKAVLENIARDPLAADLQKLILKRADEIIQARTCRFERADGKRLLPESRLALGHILHLGWAWRTTNNVVYRDRAFQEMAAICAMPSWNPEHFLDTAEMSTALAIGYDWFYPELSAAQRSLFAAQLWEKCLKPLESYKKAKWFLGASNNWSQVCHTGMTFAAIAIDEEQPQRCGEILASARQVMNQCENFYQPDGAYPEGPDYWHYGSNYHVLFMEAMHPWYPAKAKPIWQSSGEFMMHNSGGSGLRFNFADGGSRNTVPTAAQTWIAEQFSDSILPQRARADLAAMIHSTSKPSFASDSRFDPLHLLWLPKAPSLTVAAAPLVARYRGEQALVFFRSAWDKNAAWFAIKGGTGAASHGHMDVGSFVYDAHGERWFVDLGKENYNFPGYFGKQRWDYFRLNNRSHNTLVIDARLQSTPAKGCEIAAIEGTKSAPSCRIEMTHAYEKQADSLQREARFETATGKVDLIDTIVKPIGPVRWAIVTDAEVQIAGRQVILKKKGKTITMNRLDDAGGVWEEYSLKPPTEIENPNKGFRMIGFTAPAQLQLTLHVSWQP